MRSSDDNIWVDAFMWAFRIDKPVIVAWLNAGRPRRWWCGFLHRGQWWRVSYLQEFVCAICVSDYEHRCAR